VDATAFNLMEEAWKTKSWGREGGHYRAIETRYTRLFFTRYEANFLDILFCSTEIALEISSFHSSQTACQKQQQQATTSTTITQVVSSTLFSPVHPRQPRCAKGSTSASNRRSACCPSCGVWGSSATARRARARLQLGCGPSLPSECFMR